MIEDYLLFNNYVYFSIEEFCKGKDVEVQTNVGGGHGIIVTIKEGKPGKTIMQYLLSLEESILKPLLQKNRRGFYIFPIYFSYLFFQFRFDKNYDKGRLRAVLLSNPHNC